MLIKEVVQEFADKVRYIDDNYGDSNLAKRFGVKHYPVVFIDDVLVARPRDFYEWGQPEGGRYLPWRSADSHQRFRDDLRRMISIRLRGGELETSPAAESAPAQLASLPSVEMLDLQGRRITPQDLMGKVVLVEFWATWCPPCIKTMRWLVEAEKNWGGDVVVVAIAVESPEDQVRAMEAKPGRLVLGNAELMRAFGDVLAVPTLFLFDRQGGTAQVFYGAPDDLHAKIDDLVSRLR